MGCVLRRFYLLLVFLPCAHSTARLRLVVSRLRCIVCERVWGFNQDLPSSFLPRRGGVFTLVFVHDVFLFSATETLHFLLFLSQNTKHRGRNLSKCPLFDCIVLFGPCRFEPSPTGTTRLLGALLALPACSPGGRTVQHDSDGWRWWRRKLQDECQINHVIGVK